MMKSFVENVHTDRVAAKRRLNGVIERLNKLQQEQESSKRQLRQHLRSRVTEAIEELIVYLKSPEVIDSLADGTRMNFQKLKDRGKSLRQAS